MPEVTWSPEVSVTVVGDGTGGAYLEGTIPLDQPNGKLLAYRLRRTAGAGNPDLIFQQVSGETDTATTYNLVAPITPSGSSAAPVLFDPPVPYQNPGAAELYVVFDNNGGAGEASTWAVSVAVETD